MKMYKNVLNIVALTIVLVFFAWMFSTVTPEKQWKPKHSFKYATKNIELKTPMEVKPLSEILFPPKQF